MNKIALKVLIIISAIIIICGIFVGIRAKNELKTEAMPTDSIYVDGTDFTGLAEAFVEIGSGLARYCCSNFLYISSSMHLVYLWNCYANIMDYKEI